MSMRILMTQRRLIEPGGSELFCAEVAIELRRRGHDVAVFSPRIGDIAMMMFANGVQVKSRLADLPWKPDVIHGQHHLQAVAALGYFPDTPAIYYCHGVTPWVERIPIHRRIRRYVMMCEWMVTTTVTEHGLAPERVTFIPNGVNTERFSRVRQVKERPERALIFGNNEIPAEVARLETACRKLNITLDKIGKPYGDPAPRPEAFLADYDLVFAIGRCAVEALASGCAVIPVIPGLAGELIDPGNFDRYAFSNFSPRYYTSGQQVTNAWLASQLSGYSRANVEAVCARVRGERTIRRAVDALENIYAEAIRHPVERDGSAEGEFAAYLEYLSSEVDELWLKTQRPDVPPISGLRHYLTRASRYLRRTISERS